MLKLSEIIYYNQLDSILIIKYLCTYIFEFTGNYLFFLINTCFSLLVTIIELLNFAARKVKNSNLRIKEKLNSVRNFFVEKNLFFPFF